MVLDILLKVQFSPLERYLARRQYRTFVLDPSVSSSSSSSFSEENSNKDIFPGNKVAH